MSSLWDSIKIEDDSSNEPGGSNDCFTIQYGTESVKVPCSENLTLEQAISKYASKLGYAPGRAVTFRHDQNVVTASQRGEAGARYMASVQLETKGL